MNKFIVLIITTAIFCTGFVLPAAAQTPSGKFSPSEKAWKWADKQLKQMSAEEKVGQVVYIGLNAKFANEDSEYFKELRRQVVDNHIGGVIFFGAPIYETT